MDTKEKQVKEEQGKEKEKCFVMMPISNQGDYPNGHFTKIYEQIFKPAIEAAGYEAYRVDENAICDPIIQKIFSAIQECPMALCDLSNRNPNVLYELGLRQAYDKPVVLVQDDKTDKIFDVSGISTVFYKSDRIYEDVIDAREKIKNAIIETKEGNKKSIVTVVKAQTAQISTEGVTREDQIEILLSGIMDEIKELKRDKANVFKNGGEPSYCVKSKSLNWAGDNIRDSARDVDFEFYTLVLKEGITNEQIESEIAVIEQVVEAEISYRRVEEKIIFNLKNVRPSLRLTVSMWLKERLIGEQNE